MIVRNPKSHKFHRIGLSGTHTLCGRDPKGWKVYGKRDVKGVGVDDSLCRHCWWRAN